MAPSSGVSRGQWFDLVTTLTQAKRLSIDQGIVHRICGQLCGQPGCRHPQAAQIQALHQIA